MVLSRATVFSPVIGKAPRPPFGNPARSFKRWKATGPVPPAHLWEWLVCMPSWQKGGNMAIVCRGWRGRRLTPWIESAPMRPVKFLLPLFLYAAFAFPPATRSKTGVKACSMTKRSMDRAGLQLGEAAFWGNHRRRSRSSMAAGSEVGEAAAADSREVKASE